MGNFIFLQIDKSLQEKACNFEYLLLSETKAYWIAISDEMLKVHLGALHDYMGILSLWVLVDLLYANEVPDVLDHEGACLWEILHVADLIVKILILIICFNFDLLQCINAIFKHHFVYMGIALSYFLHHPDILKIVVPFD